MLNIAGPEYDFANVVYAVLEECEHRRRGYDQEELDDLLMADARRKLAEIRRAYDEFGGAGSYWQQLEKEVLATAMPQYIAAAEEMNRLERTRFDIWRQGDPLARLVFALAGLFLGSLLIAIPFIRIVESAFAFGLTIAGALYPEIKRFTHERRHARVLNALVAEAARYQKDAKLHYMTTSDIRASFSVAPPLRELGDVIEAERTDAAEK
jgi:hypothetical protein